MQVSVDVHIRVRHPPWRDTIIEAYIPKQESEYYNSKDDRDIVVGSLQLGRGPDEEYYDTMFGWSLHVHPAFWNLGIAKLIKRKAIELHPDKLGCIILDSNIPSQRVSKALGFKCVGPTNYFYPKKASVWIREAKNDVVTSVNPA